MQTIMLATGIECSYPKVEGGKRRDQLEETRHYEYWREDFGLCKELGARIVRYGIPYYKMHTAYLFFHLACPRRLYILCKRRTQRAGHAVMADDAA